MGLHRLSAQTGHHHGLLVQVGAWWSADQVRAEVAFALQQAPPVPCSASQHQVIVQKRLTGGWDVDVLCLDTGGEPSTQPTEGTLQTLRLATRKKPIEALLPSPAQQAAQAQAQQQLEQYAQEELRKWEQEFQQLAWTTSLPLRLPKI